MKKFIVSQNLSFDSTQEFLDKRRMTEFGPMALIDTEGGDPKKIKLPGVMKGDMCSRAFKPEVRVSEVKFSPTGREWSAVTTEGILVYSLDGNTAFHPFEVSTDVNPETIKDKSKSGEHGIAISMALRLNERDVLREVLENVPYTSIEVLAQHMEISQAEKLLRHIGQEIGKTNHLQFYVLWIKHLLSHHAVAMKNRLKRSLPVVNNLLKHLIVIKESLGSICDQNRHQIELICAMAEHPRKKIKLETEESSDDDSGIHNLIDDL